MKLTISRDALAPVLSKAAKIADGKIIPVLGAVLLTAKPGHLAIMTTDQDRWIEADLEAAVSKTGASLVDAQKIAQIVAALPVGAQIEMQSSGDVLTLRSGRANYRLACFDLRDAPEFPKIKNHVSVAIDGSELARVIRFTGWSVSNEPTRYYLCGVYLENADGKIVATATDGYTLSSTTITCEAPETFKPIIVPSHALVTLSEMGKEAESISLSIGERNLEASIPGFRFASKLIDATYPDWRMSVPREIDFTVEVDPAAFKAAIARVLPIAGNGDKGTGRVICLRAAMGELLIAATDIDQSLATDSIDAVTSGELSDLAFQSRYLLAALKCAGESFKMQITDGAMRIDRENGGVILMQRYNQNFPVRAEAKKDTA